MFKRLILDKKQEHIFRNLPKPNLANLDIVEEEDEEEDGNDDFNLRDSTNQKPESRRET